MEDEGGSGTKGSHWEQTLFAVRGGWGRPRSKASLTVISQPSCHVRLTIGAPTHLSIPSPHAPRSFPPLHQDDLMVGYASVSMRLTNLTLAFMEDTE